MNLRVGMRRMRVVVWLFLSISIVLWLFGLYVGYSPRSVVWLPILGSRHDKAIVLTRTIEHGLFWMQSYASNFRPKGALVHVTKVFSRG